MYLTSDEIDRAVALPEEATLALKAHAANSPGWFIRARDKASTLYESFLSVAPGTTGVWLPVSTEDCILAAVRHVHTGKHRPAEWAAMVDIRSLPVFSDTGVSMGVRWIAGISMAKAHTAGEGPTSRLATLDFLQRYLGKRHDSVG